MHQGREEETVTRTGIGAGTGTRKTTGMSTRGRDGGEGRESLGTYKVVLKVGRKARDGGLCQRVTINQSHKTRLVASCEEPEGQDRVGRRSGE